MKEIAKNLSITTQGIKHKVAISFALTSILPILVLIYLSVYGPAYGTAWPTKIWYIVPYLITFVLIIWGVCLIKRVIDPVIELAARAKHILNGQPVKRLKIEEEDEIGSLDNSLTRLSSRLKENMSELHLYGEKIKQINMEINKKMLALSSLLQIGNVLTSESGLDEILTLIVEKLAQITPTQQALIMLRDKETEEIIIRAHTAIDVLDKNTINIKIKAGEGTLGKIIESKQALYLDRDKKQTRADETLARLLPQKNIAILPITVSGNIMGILGIGNDAADFIFTPEEIELLGVFVKQIAIAVENNTLTRRAKELTIKDEETGLYNETYIRNRLEEEIKRAVAYQRPCSFIILQFDNLNKEHPMPENQFSAKILKKTADILKTNTTEIDKAAQFGRHCFAIVAPERNKRQAFNLAENIRGKIENNILQQNNLMAPLESIRLSAGISATPIDGATAQELIDKAFKYVKKAKDANQHKTVFE
ncbi:MAG: diguanylate cyclase [Candidatus Omnitrophota bacterium]